MPLPQGQGLFLAFVVYGILCRSKETAITTSCFFEWRLPVNNNVKHYLPFAITASYAAPKIQQSPPAVSLSGVYQLTTTSSIACPLL